MMADLEIPMNLVLDAVEVVNFKLIRKQEDINDEAIAFKPEMAHQIFGESERIFGYSNLTVNLMYTAGGLNIYLNMKHTQKAEDFNMDLKADDVLDIISEKLPEGSFTTNIDDFLKNLEKDKKFMPYGEKIQEHNVKDTFGTERQFEIYKCDITVPNFEMFFQRLESFVLWFVDAASFIDTNDNQWIYFICYEKYKDTDGNTRFATVGYTTVYQYYAYPEHIRPRISQLLILPPFQKLGIGTKFIETIYKYYLKDFRVIDLTVEDPSDDFKKLRNYVEAKLCKDLPSFQPDVIKNGFSKQMIKEAREEFKINPKQCRVVYEILRLLYTNINNNEEYKNYRLDVKKRLSYTFSKQMRDIEKIAKTGRTLDTQWIKSMLPPKEERIIALQEEYKEVEKEYLKTIKKLK